MVTSVISVLTNDNICICIVVKKLIDQIIKQEIVKFSFGVIHGDVTLEPNIHNYVNTVENPFEIT